MSAHKRHTPAVAVMAAAVARGRETELAERRQSAMQANAQLYSLHH